MPDTKKFDVISNKISRLRAKRIEILRMEPDKALAAIINEPESVALVHSIPEEDLFILMHDVGVYDFLPVLAMASDRQWEHILDMEIWKADRVSLFDLGKWLDVLMKADAPRLVKWLMESRIDIAEFYLNQNIELRIREHDEDPSDFEDGFTTFDDVFYFRIRPPEYSGVSLDKEAAQDRYCLIDSLLKGFASLDYPKMLGMLQESEALLASEEEEELYRQTIIRLTEKGFIPFEEALGVYQPLAGWETHETGKRKVAVPEDEPALSFLPSVILSGSGFFKDLPVSFERMDLPDGFDNEIAALCNRIIVSDRMTVRSRDGLRQVLSKACGYIILGMDEISEKIGLPSDSLISDYYLIYLFRAGYSRVVSLQREVRKWIENSWFRNQEIPLSFWGEEWMGVLGGLLLKRPLFFCNYESGLLYRDFRHEDDIARTRRAIDSMVALDSVFARMGASIPGISGALLQSTPFILTMWANHWLKRTGGEFPIPLKEFSGFYGTIIENGEISAGMKENFIEWLSSVTSMELPEIFERIWFAFEDVFKDLENEYRYVNISDLDPRYIKYFYLS